MGAVEAADEVGSRRMVVDLAAALEDALLLAGLLLLEEVVGGGDLVVPVRLDALDSVVWVIVELVEQQLVHLVVDRHRLLAREQAPRVAVSL
jgi:hypothetical protein